MSNKITVFCFAICLCCLAIPLSAQIDMKEGTVQAIAYWDLNERQAYDIHESDLSISKGDTTSVSMTNYTVNISVSDSTSYGYVLDWLRRQYKFNNVDPLEAALGSALENYPIQLITNEYGGDVQVLNWEDIRIHVNAQLDQLSTEYPSERSIKRIAKERKKYETKETVQDVAIHDITQFFAYHGAKYKLGEQIKANIKVANNYGGDPLDASTAMVLDEIIPGNDTYILKSFQNINPQQLTAVTYDYLSSLNIVEGAIPAFEDFPTIMKQIWGGSELHGSTGWLIYSQESQQVTSGENVTIQERIIELAQ